MPETPVDPLAPLLCFDLYVASRAVTAAYRPILAELDLTYPQYLVLVVLAAQQEGVPIKHLRDALRLDHATLTPLVRRLEASGLVERRRNGGDERSVLVGLTARGRATSTHFHDVQCQVAELLDLDAGEVGALRDLLRRVASSAQASLAADR